jgi:outer membrane murein-binding lipoprotein Lpp
MMRKVILLLATLSLLSISSYGCASKEYVRQQIDPLVDRISKLEATTQGLKDCCGKAEAAAERAEAAAKRSEAAAAKAVKSFDLQQKK